MTKYPIPDAALARHIACVGETGSGKTHDTKTLVEHVVAEGYRVCVLDTIKSDWWGITSSASGKRPGLPFTILGGPRGHVPLHSNAGKAIGQLVGEGKLPLSIIDMADFEPGGPQRFFEHFAQSLWKHTKGVVYLVIEEAHELAPKERAGFGAENMAIHWAKKLATGSRTKGIRLIISSQRTQAVHNALLGSCGTLLAHALSYPADQKPVIDWLKANLRDQDLVKTITSELAFLPQGTAWVCCAKDNFFEKIKFPKIATFDNTATPDKDADEFEVATAGVDADALRSIIGDAVKEAEANDPKALKAEISRLRAQLAKPAAIAAAPVDTSAIEAKAFARGQVDGYNIGFGIGVGLASELAEQSASDFTAAIIAKAAKLRPPPFKVGHTEAPASVAKIARQNIPRINPATPKTNGHASGTNSSITAPQLRLLNAIAFWIDKGFDAPTKPQIAVVAGYSLTASTFSNNLGALRSQGLIDYPSPGAVTLTHDGESLADGSRQGSVLDAMRAILSSPQMRIVDALSGAGVVEKATLAEQTGYSITASTFSNNLGALRSLKIIDYPKPGEVLLSDWVLQ